MKKYLNYLIGAIASIVIIILVLWATLALSPVSEKIDRNSQIQDIVFNDKINIYVFWGNGCPHCEHLLEYLDSINKEYKKYYNIYAFEVWDNQDNNQFMKQLASAQGDSVRGVPYYIIGSKSFVGFSTDDQEEIVNTILEEKDNKEDNLETVIEQYKATVS